MRHRIYTVFMLKRSTNSYCSGAFSRDFFLKKSVFFFYKNILFSRSGYVYKRWFKLHQRIYIFVQIINARPFLRRNYLKRKKRFSVGVLYVFCNSHLSLRGTKQSVPICYIFIILNLFWACFVKNPKLKPSIFLQNRAFRCNLFLPKLFPSKKKDFHCNRSRKYAYITIFIFLTLRSYGAPFSTLYFFYKHFVPTEQFLSYEKSTFLFF